MPDWKNEGSHRYYREPDLLFVEAHGDLQCEEIKQLWEMASSIEKTCGYLICIFDFRDGKSISPEARRYIGERNRERTLQGPVFMIGASLMLRTIALMLQHAARLFGKTPAPVYFCASPEELPPLVAAQRTALASYKKI